MRRRLGIHDRHVRLVVRICETAGAPDLIERLQRWFAADGIAEAVATRNTGALYDWLIGAFSYQGVSDAVATSYIATHGNATHADLDQLVGSNPVPCSKLVSFDAYRDCGFRKAAWTCANPTALPVCPVGRLRLRNGRLNQTAFALYLFIRDICQGDLVGFIDQRLAMADRPGHPDRPALMATALIDEFQMIHGVSNKILNMALADLLIAADPQRADWRAVGVSMVAIDTLVHNFLHRTGLIRRSGAGHAYGAACYGEGGCAGVIDRLARLIDARQFNPSYPTYFPRFIQHALWRHCAIGELDVCNGLRIGRHDRCRNRGCPVHQLCDRLPLRSAGSTADQASGTE